MTLRWALKRTLKWAMEWGMALSGLGRLYRRSRRFQTGWRILTYHQIVDRPQTSHALTIRHFRDHMAYLSDNYPMTGLSELVNGLISGRPPEHGAVAVTFDDGYLEAADTVSGILLRYRVPATFFVITGVLDRDRRVSRMRGPFMTWDHVRCLASSGLSIGSHTVTHRSLPELSGVEAEQELLSSRNRIAYETGQPPSALSYPYGTLRDFSHDIATLARRVGYGCAVTAIHGLNHASCDPFLLRRTTLTAGDGLRTFRMILRGYLDPWVFVDTWASRFQRVREQESQPKRNDA
jgi:peptidoglycan/xylan/chitin deacetylase (PgdA/CDA1 family)